MRDRGASNVVIGFLLTGPLDGAEGRNDSHLMIENALEILRLVLNVNFTLLTSNPVLKIRVFGETYRLRIWVQQL